MKICIGIGNDGEILEDLEVAKSCNFCTKFRGLGLHYDVSGSCKETGEEFPKFKISYTFSFSNT